jgi:DNA-directed RNA polymerase specialized sigma24 family protein
VQTLAETSFGQADPFAATHWSVIAAACKSQADPTSSRAALAELCETYWPPLYTYARAQGFSTHDAQDLTQGFFAYALEHKIYKQTDPAKGKFRSFLLVAFKNFLSDARDRANALKRGGGCVFVPFEEAKLDSAESVFQGYHGRGTDAAMPGSVFERTWAKTLVATALDRIAALYQREGKENIFRELKPFVAAGAAPLPTYAELALRLGIAESTLRSHVTRLRARYREALRTEVRRTVDSDAEIDAELRELLRLLTIS